MNFWDSSAVVPLLIAEPQSALCKQLLQQDPEMVVWVLTPTEIYSACYRKIRDGTLADEDFEQVRQRLQLLETAWSAVIQIDTTQRIAQRLLAVHPLRAADALQLAAALVATDQNPAGTTFISFDANLNRAARREGVTVVTS